jgi:hypothetical protein
MQDPQEAARVLRLAAASDGASRAIVNRALALPIDQGIDEYTVWVTLGLALRERRDPAPYLALIRDYKDESADKVLEFITAARSGTNPADAEQLLDGHSAGDHGCACAGRMAPRCGPVAVRAGAAVLQRGAVGGSRQGAKDAKLAKVFL